MAAKRVFISFDFDNDQDLRDALVGQAKLPDSPFTIQNWSVKEPFSGNWQEKVRRRIRQTDLTIVICGDHTHKASGVAAELRITREERKPYFLLNGHKEKIGKKPTSALPNDTLYRWTWPNLKKLVGGER